MGIDHDITRRSSRLVNRFESLRTGVTPYQRFFSSPGRNKCTVKTISANYRHSSIHKYSSDIQALENCDSLEISHDISLERSPLITDNSHAMAGVETRLDDMEFDVKGLKTDVTTLKTDVTAMNGKLDDLLQAMAKLSTNAPVNEASPALAQQNANHNSNQHTTQQTNHAAQHNHSQNQGRSSSQQNTSANGPDFPQHRTNRDISPEEFLEREMNRDRFDYDNGGKYLYGSHFSSGRVFHKPYMYLYRDGVSTIKQKVEARPTMTVVEYIDATLALLADSRAYHRDDYIDIMDHLRKLTRDALERPWCAVRRWSQFVWDSIEAGALTWADRDMIQEERVRMCLTAATNNASNNTMSYNNTNATRKNHGAQEVICRQYNTRSGCQFRESHMDGNVFALHYCTYCDSIGRSCGHSVRECERRLAHTRNDYGSNQNRQRAPHSNQYGAPYQNQVFNQNSKNGY